MQLAINDQLAALQRPYIYRLAHSASELSGFTRTRLAVFANCGFENYEFSGSKRVQVNPDNSQLMSALTAKEESSNFGSAEAMV